MTVFATGQDAMISWAMSMNGWAERMPVQMDFVGPWQSDQEQHDHLMPPEKQ